MVTLLVVGVAVLVISALGAWLWRSTRKPALVAAPSPVPVLAPAPVAPAPDPALPPLAPIVTAAITAQLAYEAAHGARQRERLQHLDVHPHGPTEAKRTTADGVLRQHGHYDDDQRRASVLIRVKHALRKAGHHRVPHDLAAQIAAALEASDA